MAIPSKFDGDAAAVDNAAANILLQLRVMQNAAPNDLGRLRGKLRDMLQQYSILVMSVARQK